MKILATAATVLGLMAFSGAAFAMCSGMDAKPDQTAETPIVVQPTTGS